MMPLFYPPFTNEQIAAFNAWQQRNDVHPLTCSDHRDESLVIFRDGLRCKKCGSEIVQRGLPDLVVTAYHRRKKS